MFLSIFKIKKNLNFDVSFQFGDYQFFQIFFFNSRDTLRYAILQLWSYPTCSLQPSCGHFILISRRIFRKTRFG